VFGDFQPTPFSVGGIVLSFTGAALFSYAKLKESGALGGGDSGKGSGGDGKGAAPSSGAADVERGAVAAAVAANGAAAQVGGDGAGAASGGAAALPTDSAREAAAVEAQPLLVARGAVSRRRAEV